MTENDKREFKEILQTAFATYNRDASLEVIKLWWGLLSRFPMEAVRAGFEAHMLDSDAGRFCPTPAHIAGQIEKRMPSKAQLTADEAWSIAVQALDEESTVVWTQPIAEAFGIAREAMPDRVAARMAFKSAYERLMAQLPAGAELRWFPSMGKDAARREDALQRAVEQGRLTADHAAGLLPAPKVTEESKQIAAQYLSQLKMITGGKA